MRISSAGPALLAEITADLAAGHDLGDLLRRFLAPMIALAGAQAGAVRLLTEDELHLRLIGQLGLPPAVAGSEEMVDSACGVCGQAATEQRATWAADLDTCRLHSRGEAAYFGGACRRVLAVPMQRRGRVLGVYSLFFAEGCAPSDEAMPMLRSIAELLALALDNARLERENLQATLVAERQLMAAEVHDAVAQSLAYIKMRMPLLEEAILAGAAQRSLHYVADVRRAVSEAHSSLREILTHFRAPVPAQGLLPALADVVNHFPERVGVPLHYLNRAPRLALAPGQEAQVFHIVQEALANVAKHARANQAWLTLQAEEGHVSVCVEDDGQGCDAGQVAGPADGEGHHGLSIMRERARRLGGDLEIDRREGGGTRVLLNFQLQAPAVAPSRSENE